MRSDFLSDSTRMRMIRLFLYLNHLGPEWQNEKLSSQELALAIESTAATVRKDLSCLNCRADGWGYRASHLIQQLKETLLLNSPVRTGVAGLEPWGSILLEKENLLPGVLIRAGFDSSMNRLERTSSRIPLYPAYEIPEIFHREGLLLGILASDEQNIQQTAERMISGGALALLNLTPLPVRVPEGVFLHQADIQSGILKLISQINWNERN
jgi:redox-sensing transcriptional repressor